MKNLKILDGNIYWLRYTRDPGFPADKIIQIVAGDIYEAIEIFRINVDKDEYPAWLAEIKITDGFGNTAGTLIEADTQLSDMEDWD